MNTPIYGKKRTPRTKNDFGDIDTVGLCLKKSGVSADGFIHAGPDEHIFGRYLGEYQDKWYVGTYTWMDWTPTGLAEYDTLEQLKSEWELD